MLALVVRFEVKPEAIDDFDALVAETLEGIRREEAETLLYFSAGVPDDPCSRVFVEIYSDAAAFQEHESLSHTKRFLAGREALLDSYRVEFLTPIDGKFPAW